MALAKTLWTSIVDLVSTGQDVSDKLDTAFGNIDDAITQIDTNTADITALKTYALFVPTYDYTQVPNFIVTNDVYEQVARLTTASRAAGTYKLDESMLYSLNSTTTSAFFRFSVDGGLTWSEIRREPKDNLDVLAEAYTSTIVHAGGVIDIVIQARKENASDVLTIHKLDIILERKA